MQLRKEFDMSKYRYCSATVDACKGCGHEFPFKADVVNPAKPEEVVEVRSIKCECYAQPEAHWPRKDVKYTMATMTVRANKGTAEKELPLIDHRCAMATHIERDSIVNTVTKVHAGQGKTKSGGNR